MEKENAVHFFSILKQDANLCHFRELVRKKIHGYFQSTIILLIKRGKISMQLPEYYCNRCRAVDLTSWLN
jgi:hypothetical protein